MGWSSEGATELREPATALGAQGGCTQGISLLRHFITSHKVFQWLPVDNGIKSRRFLGTSNKILCSYCPSMRLISSLPSFSPRRLPSSTPTALASFPHTG